MISRAMALASLGAISAAAGGSAGSSKSWPHTTQLPVGRLMLPVGRHSWHQPHQRSGRH